MVSGLLELRSFLQAILPTSAFTSFFSPVLRCWVLDQHAPLASRKVTNRPSAPWRTDSVRTAKRELRQAERKWRSSGLTVYKELCPTKLIAYTASIRKAKRQYYNDVICNCPSKQLYNVSNQLFGRIKKFSLTNNIPSSDLPDTFCQFFNNKVEQLQMT